jgi:signal transduction histidine kinase/phage shock protein PspC (stress-responsive transcriptional regulator)
MWAACACVTIDVVTLSGTVRASREDEQRRRAFRSDEHRVFGGVVAGITEHLGLPGRGPRVLLRTALVVLTGAGGLGVVLYGAYWLVLPRRPGEAEKRAMWVQYVAGAVAAVAVVAVVARTGSLSRNFLPTLVAVLGAALVWRQAGEADRQRWTRLSASSLSSSVRGRDGLLRLTAGATMVLIGAVLVVKRNAGLTQTLGTVIVVVIVAGGFALITGPLWMRMVRDLSAERRERIRVQERAELAAHLHDSVLQTLALIQRNAGNAREVARLARSQERELRTLLYGSPRAEGTVAEALQNVVGEIEDRFVVTIDSVIVGDATQDERLQALVLAAREAMSNAAKHAGVASFSLYAEIDADAAEVFVRDRGRGFDVDAVAPDRHGLRGSIRERVERHGGTAEIRSTPGAGTEIELRMRRR